MLTRLVPRLAALGLTVSLVLGAVPPAVAATSMQESPAAELADTLAFGYTGDVQTWTVPEGVASIGVDAEGAQGAGEFGGLGGWTHAVVPVTPGQVVRIYVGGRGRGATAGWNGGGGGGCCGSGAAGGGASDVRLGGTDLTDRVVVAGGGGGSHGDVVFGQGGAGGGLSGGDGGDGSGQWQGGGGGTQSGGGSTGGNFAAPGRLGEGGESHFGGSGGGGYYGGGGGEADSYGGSAGGGGGGSSYAAPSTSASNFLPGAHQGDGRVVITNPPAVVPPEGTSPGTAAFTSTGHLQYWRVPAGVTRIQVDLRGGQGATPDGTGGGLGGRVQAIIPVTPYQLITVAVAGAGRGRAAGWNGGGDAGCCDSGVPGGGASDIRINGLTLSDRQVVAGGGGGGGDTYLGAPPGGAGGAGGGLSGAAGGDGSGQWKGGGGGTQTAGGSTGGNFAVAGRLGQGGASHFGGSGGGGYYGGGGGEGDSYGGTSGGGGGGSGYVTPKASESLQEDGQQAGDGSITISTTITGLTQTPRPEAQSFGPSGATTHGRNPTASPADPVNTATGAYFMSKVDATLPNIGVPFVFRRNYTSADTTAGPLGVGWVHSLGARLTVASSGDVTLRGEDGQQLLYTKQPDGSFRGASGARSILGAVADGFELVRHDQVRYRFDTEGRLRSLQDRNGHGVSLAYDNAGHLAGATLSGDRTVRFSSNTDGLLTGMELPDGRRVSYAYANGRLAQVVDMAGKTTRYAYDEAGRLTSVVDPNGHTVIRNTYGPDGRVLEQYDAVGNHITFAWDPDSATSTMTDGRGNQWQDVYRDRVLVRQVDPLGHEAKYEYDSDLNLTAITDPRGNTTTMRYDSRGNLLERVAPTPLGYRQRFEYNERNDLVNTTDGRDNTTTFAYDSQGNLVRQTGPDGAVTAFARDPAGTGLLASITDPNGHTTRLTHDDAGNLIRTVSPRGRATTTTFDAGGRPTEVVDPRGNVSGANPNDYRTRLAYDPTNRLTSVTDPLGIQTQYRYDAAGNLIGRTDANGHVISYTYDDADRLVAVTAPDGAITRYAYDPAGNLARRTDANAHLTTYNYDAANRRVEMTSPIGQRWTVAYDPTGNPTSVVTAVGTATPADGDGAVRMSYDALNRLTEADYSDGTPDVTLAYDANGNRTEMTDGAGVERRTYDAYDRLQTVTRDGRRFNYRYDQAGNLLSRSYPDGTQVDLAYDEDNQLSAVTNAGRTTRYTYDPAGNLLGAVMANGTAEDRTYDRAGRLLRVRSALGKRVVSDVTAVLDPVGNPLREDRPEGTVGYDYDARNRLVRACYSTDCRASAGVIRYEYDKVGNRTLETRSGVAEAGSYQSSFNAADQLTTTRGPQGVVSYRYDANGNQTAAGPWQFGYDLANRLTKATLGPHTSSYTYDGEDKRLTASADDSPGRGYDWDPNYRLPQLALEREGGSEPRRYVYGQGRISTTTGAGTSYYHHDRLGSVTALTDSSGQPQWSYSYEPFGKARSISRRNGQAPGNPMRFAGEYLDPTTSRYHLRAREYDPTQGRFLQPDPIEGDIDDPYVAAYVYVQGRPAVLTDPAGLQPTLPSWQDVKQSADIVHDAFNTGAGLLAVGAAGTAVVGVVVAPVAPPVGAALATVAGGLGALATVAGGVTIVAGGVYTAIECLDGGPIRKCGTAFLGVGIDAATFRLGREVSKRATLNGKGEHYNQLDKDKADAWGHTGNVWAEYANKRLSSLVQ
jgi:RHS repeat-associated protein